MEIDQPIPHLVDESQPTPNNMTNELMKDTRQLLYRYVKKKIEFTHFITIPLNTKNVRGIILI